jgi:hypothetical protein
MKSKIKITLFTTVLLLASFALRAQARLTIENNSMRSMTVKVMKGYSGKGTLNETVNIGAYSSETVYFSESGYYFTKTKAVLKGKDPVYRKGQPFSVTNDETGYSVMTLTFSIKESSIPKATGGKAISKTEFDQN